MVEWRRSRPEPGKGHPDIPSRSAAGIAQITVSQPERFRPTTRLEFSHACHDPETGVIILTGAGEMSEEAQNGRYTHPQKRKPDFARFPGRP